MVCRYGGEEFGILLTQANAQHAMNIAEKLRKMVAGWQFPGVPRTVTISAGAAAFPEHGTTRDELVRAADHGSLRRQAGGTQPSMCLAARAQAGAHRTAAVSDNSALSQKSRP